MKKIILLAITLLVSLSLIACSEKEESGQTTSSSSSSNGSQDTIVIGVASDWKTLDPARAYEVFGNFYFYATYENLYMLEGSELIPKPALAKEYSVDESGLVYTFKLVEGRKFASGNPITANDVVFSFNRTMNIKDNASALAEGVEKVEAPDENTVVVTLKEQDASFLSKLTSNAFAVVDSQVVKEQGGTDAEDASTTDTATAYLDGTSAGSGPYVLTKWTQNTEMVLEKNPNYPGTVNASKIIIKEIPDPNTQIQALEKGEIDVALSVGPDQVKTIKDGGNAKVVSSPTSTISFLLMNNSPEIGKEMSDPLVQQAVRYALDYEGFKQLAGDGALLPMSFVQDGFVGAQSRADNYQNIEKAKELMKEAGFENGFTVPLIAANYDSEGLSWVTIAEKVKEDLSKININVEIQTGDVGVVIEDYRNGKTPFLVMHWSPDYYDLSNQLAFIPGDIVGTRANWDPSANPELVALAEQAKVEIDEAKRAELSGKMQEIIAENSPYAFLVQHPKSFAVSANLEGVAYNDLFKLSLKDLKLSK
ncbi:ABC transporter substrate-binding protein [Lysinibacillus endophyticus]|uniref:ABC transporter substrate-binding protein n=1 Tax=Ureibacillus endophyticus TaxID=1978490 RepID=UPI00209C9260|nr:ABC transporter substrate-binding protein [Lysinibacillus endophyticus]MCP1144376.1 ABC transporter substrate-binding protein [Lysinibacillus endophyticus]